MLNVQIDVIIPRDFNFIEFEYPGTNKSL